MMSRAAAQSLTRVDIFGTPVSGRLKHRYQTAQLRDCRHLGRGHGHVEETMIKGFDGGARCPPGAVKAGNGLDFVMM
jgi:hypothetical protein